MAAHAKDIWTTPDWEKREKLAACAWMTTCTEVNARHLRGSAVWIKFPRVLCRKWHHRNIVLIGGRPVPFDAIEFSDKIANIDVLYDLSFALMDLCERELRPLANRLLNEWLWRIAELPAASHDEALALLPLFLARRASIRHASN